VTTNFTIYSEWKLRQMRRRHAARLGLAALGLLAGTTSCVHGHDAALRPAAYSLTIELGPALPYDPTDLAPISSEQALAANARLPVHGQPGDRPASFVLLSDNSIDELRSLDCLSQAIYYEARSETEAGQRAVAQVVLNRMRHPSYPASVCGVVYQGPMKAGGGCQFTFTCDGSLRRRPIGAGWEQARRIAAEALSGSVYGPVGHSTHYHTNQVFPRWAPRLVKAAVIGSHIFYRFPGVGGQAASFRQAYAGREPMPLPNRLLPQARFQLASLSLPTSGAKADPASLVPTLTDALPKVRLTEQGLPESRIREAYRNAGRAIDEAAAPRLETVPLF
jgi:hypothetical protein